jgi:hypothetical protein
MWTRRRRFRERQKKDKEEETEEASGNIRKQSLLMSSPVYTLRAHFYLMISFLNL